MEKDEKKKNLSLIAFKNDIDNHSWEYVMNSDNVQEAYAEMPTLIYQNA